MIPCLDHTVPTKSWTFLSLKGIFITLMPFLSYVYIILGTSSMNVLFLKSFFFFFFRLGVVYLYTEEKEVKKLTISSIPPCSMLHFDFIFATVRVFSNDFMAPPLFSSCNYFGEKNTINIWSILLYFFFIIIKFGSPHTFTGKRSRQYSFLHGCCMERHRRKEDQLQANPWICKRNKVIN